MRSDNSLRARHVACMERAAMTNGERLLSTESSELRHQEVKLYEATWTRKFGLEVPL